MLYMCTCAYTTLMKMKLLNNYVLVPNHHTDEPTLLFIGSYLCRLTYVYRRSLTFIVCQGVQGKRKTRYSRPFIIYALTFSFPLVYNYLTISAAGKEDSTVFAGVSHLNPVSRLT